MKGSVLAALGAALLLVLWLASGHWSSEGPSAAPAEAVVQSAPGAPMRVEVSRLERQRVVRELFVQGHAEPWRSLTLRVETAGPVAVVLADKGARVAGGEAILRLAEEDRPARVEQARARVSHLQAELEAARSLERSGLQARLRVEQAQADLAAARAEFERARLDLARVVVRAPFAGVLDQRLVEVGEYLDRAAPVAVLVDDSRLRLRGDVPQTAIADLRPGLVGEARFITGERRGGELVYLGAQADPATRSYRIELAVENGDRSLRAGLSGELRLPVETLSAHFLSPALLSLDADGALGVKTVGADARVVLHPVRIVRTSAEGVWVSGLPEAAMVIIRGQGFVEPGDRVDPVVSPG